MSEMDRQQDNGGGGGGGDSAEQRPARRLDNDETLEKEYETAVAIVDATLLLSDKINETPEDGDKLVAYASPMAGASIDIAKKLKPIEHRVAILLGRGITVEKAAKLVGVSVGEIHKWLHSNPAFQNARRYYRKVAYDELGGRVLRQVEAMLEDEMLPDDLRIKLMALAHRMSSDADDRELKMVELEIKARQATNKARPTARLKYVPDDAYDAEFEVVDDD